MTSSQLTLALDDRHEGQDANLAAGIKPHQDDTARVTTALATLIKSQQPFTASDAHKILEADGHGPYDRNLVSSQMGHLAREGVIKRLWWMHPTPAMQRDRRGSRNPYWQAATRGPAQAA